VRSPVVARLSGMRTQLETAALRVGVLDPRQKVLRPLRTPLAPQSGGGAPVDGGRSAHRMVKGHGSFHTSIGFQMNWVGLILGSRKISVGFVRKRGRRCAGMLPRPRADDALPGAHPGRLGESVPFRARLVRGTSQDAALG